MGQIIPLDQLLIQILNGVINGMIIALVASGLTLIFGIMDVVNFAHGEFYMLGAYVGTTVLALTHSFWLALLAASLVIFVLGGAIQVTTLRPLLGRDPLTSLLATFGVSLVLQQYALWQYGPVTRQIAEPFKGQFPLFYISYPWYRIVVAGLSGAIVGGLWLFLKYSTFGIWIRATTQDRVMAAAMGIPVPLVHTGVFGLGTAMAGASGVLVAPLVGVDFSMGLAVIIRAFIVVVVGGMGNLGGSVAAAIFIGLLEALASIWVSPVIAVLVSFAVLILTLLVRPHGLFAPTPR
jgi:branched-subunit amino acid ABC-type transport system permease component